LEHFVRYALGKRAPGSLPDSQDGEQRNDRRDDDIVGGRHIVGRLCGEPGDHIGRGAAERGDADVVADGEAAVASVEPDISRMTTCQHPSAPDPVAEWPEDEPAEGSHEERRREDRKVFSRAAVSFPDGKKLAAMKVARNP
jgi:hypothetical protein